ncbi:MAG: hypothetical protein H0V72_22135 [Bradyrhizobium sp.]|nr:hypothetical protein [Bradyrhizobium sp.]
MIIHSSIPQEHMMTRGHETKVQELTQEQLERVAGGFLGEFNQLLQMYAHISKTQTEIGMSSVRNIGR